MAISKLLIYQEVKILAIIRNVSLKCLIMEDPIFHQLLTVWATYLALQSIRFFIFVQITLLNLIYTPQFDFFFQKHPLRIKAMFNGVKDIELALMKSRKQH